MEEIYLSVIIPAFNEEKRIPKTLESVDSYLKRQSYGYEIIVVSDGSTDKTVDIVKNLSSEIKNLKLINNRTNKGKGYVVRQGLLAASGKYRLFTDADNSTSIDQIEKAWQEFRKGYDIIIGSRDVKGAVLSPPQPWIRNIVLGEGFKLFRRLVIGLWGIEDTQCGFKVFTREAVETVLPICRINRFAFDPEILVIAEKMGYKIKEIPVVWENNTESKVKFRSIIRMALDLIKIKVNLIMRRYDFGKERK